MLEKLRTWNFIFHGHFNGTKNTFFFLNVIAVVRGSNASSFSCGRRRQRAALQKCWLRFSERICKFHLWSAWSVFGYEFQKERSLLQPIAARSTSTLWPQPVSRMRSRVEDDGSVLPVRNTGRVRSAAANFIFGWHGDVFLYEFQKGHSSLLPRATGRVSSASWPRPVS